VIVNTECKSGEPGGTRTRDHRIKSAMLYQLSYRPDGEGQAETRLQHLL
jgi:hypothetical protein